MGLKIDLNHLKELANEEYTQATQGNRGEGGQYKLVYPYANGKLTLRLLYNLKANCIQKRVIRHNTGKGKVPCLQLYGESCPVCAAIKEAEDAKGRECGAFRKYGYNTRGICYAQIIDHDGSYFTEENDPNKGDVIVFMYPKTVYDMINKIIVDSGDHIEDLIANNEGLPIVIDRVQKGNAAPTYTVSVFPYGKKKSFEDDSEKTGEQKFEELLDSLPDLNETIVPKYPNEEVREAVKALADTISAEYLGDMIMNPGDDPSPVTETKKDEPKSANLGDMAEAASDHPVSAPASLDSTPTASSDRPTCYGHHSNTDRKCLLCDRETDCYSDSENNQ